MNDDPSGGASNTEPGNITGGTDWNRLRKSADEEIRATIASDPSVKATDEAFWNDAQVVMPRRKEWELSLRYHDGYRLSL